MSLSDTVSEIRREHLIYSQHSVVVCLVLLFNFMSAYCFVPDDFDVDITTSLVKHE